MRLPTASALQRVLACPASHVFPVRVNTTGDHAERGNEIAAYVRRIVGGTPKQTALELVADEQWRKTCEGLDMQRLVGGLREVRGECAYAYHVETGETRFLGSNLGRRYPTVSDLEIVGTNDLEGRSFFRPVVRDVKTGWNPVPSPARNAQMRFHGLVLYQMTGESEVEGSIDYVREDGTVESDRHTFGPFEMDAFADELRELPGRLARAKERMDRGEVTVTAGAHCTYCPAKPACPKYTAMARAMIQDVTNVKVRLEMLSPEERGMAWEKVRVAGEIVASVTESLKEIARSEPIPLPDGKILCETRSKSSSFDKARAIEMLRERGVTDEEIASLTTTVQTKPVREVNASGTKKAPSRAKKGRAA